MACGRAEKESKPRKLFGFLRFLPTYAGARTKTREGALGMRVLMGAGELCTSFIKDTLDR